ncbi:hypothetical protein B4100_2241 [Heyndrickxia coagulans]|uniref:Uncharacterized protein n=1 Tax=Heyndrickxia coagulans TaxID=1398 RepID=A0A150K6M2_HEYCO|nr:hypothetical protein B4099_2224 [Heyndrickxia coagulans]KYC65175.1 hypothetical protein B4100_2241 [Heyndrickxia coagulans]
MAISETFLPGKETRRAISGCELHALIEISLKLTQEAI